MEYSKITDHLLVGTTPNPRDYARLRDLGVRLVINMRFWRGRAPAGSQPGIGYLRLRTFDNPLLPIPMGALMRGTRSALEVIERGGGVYIHCSRGRHRSVAMAACILVAMGWTPERAMQFIKERRAAADPGAIYIRPRVLRFARQWKREAA